MITYGTRYARVFSNGRQPLSSAINEFTPGESRSINRTLGDNDRRVRRSSNSLPLPYINIYPVPRSPRYAR